MLFIIIIYFKIHSEKKINLIIWAKKKFNVFNEKLNEKQGWIVFMAILARQSFLAYLIFQSKKIFIRREFQIRSVLFVVVTLYLWKYQKTIQGFFYSRRNFRSEQWTNILLQPAKSRSQFAWPLNNFKNKLLSTELFLYC